MSKFQPWNSLGTTFGEISVNYSEQMALNNSTTYKLVPMEILTKCRNGFLFFTQRQGASDEKKLKV